MKLKNDFAVATFLGLGITALSLGLAYALGWVHGAPNGYELGATILNYGSFYLCVKQRRAYYLIGVVASFLFAILYLQSNLLASGALSAYLTLSLFAGYFMWGKDSKSLPVRHVELKWLPAYLAVTAVSYVGASLVVSSLGGSFAFWDAAILIFTLLAQFLLDRKKIENWWVWIIGVNGAGTILYFNNDLYLVAFQQLLFGAFSVWGWYEWRKSLQVTV